MSILNLAIVKKGEGEIEGLTDKQIPRRLGPKRANNIRKLFALDKSDPVTQYVIRKAVEKNGKTKSVAPKIQRLITPVTLQRKRRRMADKVKILHQLTLNLDGLTIKSSKNDFILSSFISRNYWGMGCVLL